ncbi:hypothetical protein [Pseudoglutamicibacter cumminsii]|uniref:hypothetical protein n=1 Tax=Pseudoglutamicibacter cumminsii TaxID=156979 RepID=UPI0019592FED|nr:hypothetical protein [Pseudoglutamicibacter cumminsii]MBM7796635.1 hypothetical protein [Pseudoglutamicibacter cumminsii]
MTIEWMSFLLVFAATLVSTMFVVLMFSTGVRLQSMHDAAIEEGLSNTKRLKAGYYACYAVSGVIVLIGIALIVPALHKALGF